jgi:hypothetical protein
MAETAPDAEWDEARLEQAMQRLKLLHFKARMLRDTIPKMIRPLVKQQPSPDARFAAFTKAVNDAQVSVAQFAELMKDATSQEVLEYAKKSREERPYGIKPWMHSEHPDWFTLDDPKQ